MMNAVNSEQRKKKSKQEKKKAKPLNNLSVELDF